MTPDDDQARRLQDQLDRELAGVRSRPGDLDAILDRARREHRSRGPVPPWLAAAAAVLVVAVAVPVGVQRLDRGPERSAGLASPTTTPATTPSPTPPVVPEPGVTPSPTASLSAPVYPTRRPASPTPSRTRTSPTPTPAPSDPPAPVACTGSGPEVGKPQAVVDADGDGAGDAVSVSNGVLAVRLSAGGGGTVPLAAGEQVQSVLPVEADGTRGSELLVLVDGTIDGGATAGTRAQLYDLQDCAEAPVLNAQGTGYWFEVGTSASDTRRFGVSCTAGALVGVTSTRETPVGAWTVTSRPVTVAKGVARSGAPTTAQVPDDAAAEALEQASCGASSPQPLR